jgi:alanine racemase
VGHCEAQVELIRTLPKGHSVGYGAGWTAKRDTKIAVCNVGYFHGFGAPARNDLYRFRDCLVGALSSIKAFLTHKSLYVSVNGKPAKVLGHVGMVQTICDVTDIPCQVGDPIRVEINPLKQKNLEIIYR